MNLGEEEKQAVQRHQHGPAVFRDQVDGGRPALTLS
jgi:hypothetical protein